MRIGIVVIGVLLGLPVAAQDIWIEFESAFDRGEVTGIDRPSTHPLASGGRGIGDWWAFQPGASVRIPFEVKTSIPQAQVSIRHSSRFPGEWGPLEAKLSIDGESLWSGTLELRPAPVDGAYLVDTGGLGDLAAGEYQLHVELNHGAWMLLDALAIHPRGKRPAALNRDLHFPPERGSPFHLIFSPHVSEETVAERGELRARLQRVYQFISRTLGYEPDSPLICGVRALEDSTGNEMHAQGRTVYLEEAQASGPGHEALVRGMTFCFQDDFAHNGHMPLWFREGECHFMTLLGAFALDEQPVAEWDEKTYGNPEPLRGAMLDGFGLNVLQYYGTEWQPREHRPHLRTWRYLFHRCFLHDPELLTEAHRRLSSDLRKKRYPITPEGARNPYLVARTYIDYLVGDDATLTELFETWGFVRWPCPDQLPELGDRVLTVECGAGLPATGGNEAWHRKLDRARGKSGYSYEVAGAQCWREQDGYHWYFGNPEKEPAEDDAPLSLRLRLPKDFEGSVVLYLDPVDRTHEVHRQGAAVGRVSFEPHIVVPIPAEAVKNGECRIEVFRRGGQNGALRRFEVHRAGRPGKTRLRVECARRLKDANVGREWSDQLDEVEVSRGFGYRLLSGYAWTNHKDFQWFGHDPRAGNVPLRFEITTPKGFRGSLLVVPDHGGRVQHVVVDGEHSYLLRGEQSLLLPLDRSVTKDGRVVVEVRRREGINCALRRIEVRGR